MNPNLEACQNCPVQCLLDDKVHDVMDAFVFDEMTPEQGRNRLSVALQAGRNNGCPQSELSSSRREALRVIDPGHAEVQHNFTALPYDPRMPSEAVINMRIGNLTRRRRS